VTAAVVAPAFAPAAPARLDPLRAPPPAGGPLRVHHLHEFGLGTRPGRLLDHDGQLEFRTRGIAAQRELPERDDRTSLNR
jgi:hypothetical protein